MGFGGFGSFLGDGSKRGFGLGRSGREKSPGREGVLPSGALASTFGAGSDPNAPHRHDSSADLARDEGADEGSEAPADFNVEPVSKGSVRSNSSTSGRRRSAAERGVTGREDGLEEGLDWGLDGCLDFGGFIAPS